MTEHHPPHHVCWITPAELATFATSDGDVSFYNAMYCSSLLKAKGIRSAVANGETLPCPCGRTITSPAQIRRYLLDISVGYSLIVGALWAPASVDRPDSAARPGMDPL